MSDEHRYIAYGGARGGGKSWAVRIKAALLCLQYAGIKVMIIRRTYPELQENHILPLCELLGCYSADPAMRIAEYNDSKKNIVFPNGSRILFRFCDDERDALRFQGTEDIMVHMRGELDKTPTLTLSRLLFWMIKSVWVRATVAAFACSPRSFHCKCVM